MNLPTTNTGLIKALKASDENIFTHIYQKYHNAVYANICKFINDRTEAEDILQEVFVLLWNTRSNLKNEQKIDGWLFNVSYYKSLEYIKKKIRTDISKKYACEDAVTLLKDTSFYEMVEKETEFASKMNLLQSGIEELPNRKKSAFVLCKVYGLSYKDTALELGISPATAKDYVKSAKKEILLHIASNSTAIMILLIELSRCYLP